MLIKFWTDSVGNLYGDPKSDRQRRQLVKRIPREDRGEALIYYQQADIPEVLCGVASPQAIRDLCAGWDVTARISDDNVDAMVGAE
jgi:hypothetical protein